MFHKYITDASIHVCAVNCNAISKPLTVATVPVKETFIGTTRHIDKLSKEERCILPALQQTGDELRDVMASSHLLRPA